MIGVLAGLYSVHLDGLIGMDVEKRVDWIGAFLVTAGLVLIIFVLSDGETAPRQWSTPCMCLPDRLFSKTVTDNSCSDTDIIALLIVGVVFLSCFVLWELYLERIEADIERFSSKWTPPPLLKISIWKRSRGRFAAMQMIACVNWCSLISWTFWVQVRCAGSSLI